MLKMYRISDSLDKTLKNLQKNKLVNKNLSKWNTIAHQKKTLFRECKDRLCTGRTVFFNIYLINDSNPEYIKK